LTDKVAYLTGDNLGTPRINTDQNGAVSARHDYDPFGKEVELAQRTSALGYVGDTVRKQFTKYESDPETSLYFAEARNYSPNLGRFYSTDPLLTSQVPSSPQTFNRYIYVGNEPLRLTDPSGLLWYSRENENGTYSVRWFGKKDKVEKGYHVYMGTYDLQDKNGRWFRLNPDGPSKTGTSDFERQGWSYLSLADRTSLSANRTPCPSSPRGCEGVDTVSEFDVALAIDGLGSIPNAIRNLGRFFVGAEAKDAAAGLGETLPGTLYHYTNDETAALIEATQLGQMTEDPMVFLTDNGSLSPLQAQIELALPPTNSATSIFAVDVRALQTVNLVRQGRVTGNVFNRAGGGTEFVLNQTIPKSAFRRISR
jgi:RHS repeat-associated protein